MAKSRENAGKSRENAKNIGDLGKPVTIIKIRDKYWITPRPLLLQCYKITHICYIWLHGAFTPMLQNHPYMAPEW